jgi:hypothetical protein
MVTKQRKARRGNVPVVGARLRLAFEDVGLTHGEAARRIAPALYGNDFRGEKDVKSVAVRIDRLCSCSRLRCEPELRTALAREVELPAAWLGGELNNLPDVRFSTQRDRDQPNLPPRQQLTQYRLAQMVRAPVRREMERAESESDPRLSKHNLARFSDPRFSLPHYLERLIEPGWWRFRLLDGLDIVDVEDATWSVFGQDYFFRRGLRPASPAEHTARSHLLEALRYILAPWLEHRAVLRMEALVAAAEFQPGKSRRRSKRDFTDQPQ